MSTLQFSPVVVTLWAFVLISESCLLAILICRKTWVDYPAFTGFIAFCILRSCALLYAAFALRSWMSYFLINWGAYPLQSILLIAVVLEVIHNVFRPYDALPRGTYGTFTLAVVTVVLLTTTFTLAFPGSGPSQWMTFLRAMDQGVTWTLLSVFSLIAIFATFLGIPWNHRIYGIVYGFLSYLLVDTTVVTIKIRNGIHFGGYIWPIDMLAFLASCSMWLYSFALAEVPRSAPKAEEINRIANVLSQYVFVIETLELKPQPRTPPRHGLAHSALTNEGQ